jgi:hypothetical protein
MKTLSKITKLILVAGFTFSGFMISANTTPVETKKAKETEKTIRDYFKFPGILIPLHELNKTEAQKVEVLFTTDQNGNINFVLAKTVRRDLKAEIEKQFLKLHLIGLQRDVVHSVVLNFKTL